MVQVAASQPAAFAAVGVGNGSLNSKLCQGLAAAAVTSWQAAWLAALVPG